MAVFKPHFFCWLMQLYCLLSNDIQLCSSLGPVTVTKYIDMLTADHAEICINNITGTFKTNSPEKKIG